MTGQKRKKTPEKTPEFWTAKSGKNLEKIGFGQVFFRRPGKNTFFPSKTRTLTIDTIIHVIPEGPLQFKDSSECI